MNTRNTEFAQLLSAFLISVILSPWSWGPLYFILFLLVYETVCLWFTRGYEPFWRLEFRVGLIVASLFGWVVGRTLFNYSDPFHHTKHKTQPKRYRKH